MLGNKALMLPMGAWLLSQIIKLFINLWFERKVDINYLLGAGGMPSSHSALVASLSTAIGHDAGIGSPLFGATVVFSAIVMYDAAGVRRTVGDHARILNRLVDEILSHHQLDEARLRELVGHTPLQVVVGAILGFTFTLGML